MISLDIIILFLNSNEIMQLKYLVQSKHSLDLIILRLFCRLLLLIRLSTASPRGRLIGFCFWFGYYLEAVQADLQLIT